MSRTLLAAWANRPALFVKPLASGRRSGKMLVNEHPARATLLPNAGIPQVHLSSLTVLRFFHQMHWNRHPRNCPTAAHFQVLTRSQLDFRRAFQKLLLHAVVVLLPAMVCKRRNVIKNEAVLLGVELRWSFRRSSAPSHAVAVYELPKGGIVCGLLLCPGANESQQCSYDRQRYIQQPAPARGCTLDRLFR